jgi:hypothetical protein
MHPALGRLRFRDLEKEDPSYPSLIRCLKGHEVVSFLEGLVASDRGPEGSMRARVGTIERDIRDENAHADSN